MSVVQGSTSPKIVEQTSSERLFREREGGRQRNLIEILLYPLLLANAFQLLYFRYAIKLNLINASIQLMLIILINFTGALWGFDGQGSAKVTPVELIILPEVKREKDGREIRVIR
jgi:hypothetical protein